LTNNTYAANSPQHVIFLSRLPNLRQLNNVMMSSHYSASMPVFTMVFLSSSYSRLSTGGGAQESPAWIEIVPKKRLFYNLFGVLVYDPKLLWPQTIIFYPAPLLRYLIYYFLINARCL
jgi:hypothetical protein